MNTLTRNILSTLAGLALLIFVAVPAQAELFNFTTITGQSQADFLFLDVTEAGDSAVFTFSSAVPDSSAITSVYWDWGALASSFSTPSAFVQSAGVRYLDNSGDYNPTNPVLPGYQTASFYADFAIAPQPAGGILANGIGAGESLSVSWNLNGLAFTDLLAALTSGDTNVGLHVQGLPDGSSFSATTATPIPGAVWLLGAGLLGLVGYRRVRAHA